MLAEPTKAARVAAGCIRGAVRALEYALQDLLDDDGQHARLIGHLSVIVRDLRGVADELEGGRHAG